MGLTDKPIINLVKRYILRQKPVDNSSGDIGGDASVSNEDKKNELVSI